MSLIWGRQDPGRPHVGSTNIVIWEGHLSRLYRNNDHETLSSLLLGSVFILIQPRATRGLLNERQLVDETLKVKGKFTVLSPHPGSELCCADFDRYLPWSLGLYSPYIHLDIHLNTLGSIQPLKRNLAPRLTNLPSQVPISSWVERGNAAWSALLRGTTSRCTGRVLNQGLDLDPYPESCTLPLDHVAALLLS